MTSRPSPATDTSSCPQVVPAGLIAAASLFVDQCVTHDPPPAGLLGPHFYFLPQPLPPELLALLFESPAASIAASLTDQGQFEVPDHVQVSLNIPVVRKNLVRTKTAFRERAVTWHSER